MVISRRGWSWRGLVLMAALVLVTATGISTPARSATGGFFTPGHGTFRGAVASVHPAASQIGVDILNQGGNAVDAAVATAFALGVLRPEYTGPGGGGFMLYRSADGADLKVLDFRETAPADVTETFRDGSAIDDYHYGGYTGAGHRVVGVPGNVAGLTAAMGRYGTKTLDEVISPAAEIAENGFIVSEELQNWLFLGIPYLRMFPETAKVFLHDSVISYPSSPFFDPLIDNTPGDTWELRQPEHAWVLRQVALHGPDVFYKGEIADLLVAGFDKYRHLYASPEHPFGPPLMTREDVANYRPVWREPVRTNYRGYEVIGVPPPASGGVFVAETLNLLEGFPYLAEGGSSNADHLHLATEAMKIALADRKQYLGDPDHVDVPTKMLTSKKYADERRAEIDRYRTRLPGQPDGSAARHTTHLSVIDAAGNAVSMTLSLNGGFGSGVVAEGTGFVLNNHLLDFDTQGLDGPSNPQTGVNNRPGPGRRPVSAVSPTIVVRDGKTAFIVGGAGGPTVLRGVPQAIMNYIEFGMDAAHALDAERIFPANDPAPFDPSDNAVDVLNMEGGRIASAVKDELRRRGHRLENPDVEYLQEPVSPMLTAISVDLATGWRVASAEPRTLDNRSGAGPAAQ